MRFGSLFSGYGGLDMGLQSVLGGRTAWFCEFDKAPSAILAHHWPDVPNLGDITTVDFTTVEQVDVLTGGFPCQDVSHAGRRAGLIRDGEGRTRSGLWGHMLRAITELRPSLVVAENVRGLLSARADSDVEPCPWCLGDASGEPDMRALGAVLADLADVGYDAAWYGLRAADVGAAHGRFRVFIFAWPADAEGDTRRLLHGDIQAARHADRAAGERGRPGETGSESGTGEGQARATVRGVTGGADCEPRNVPGQLTLLPTPTTADHGSDAPNRVGSPSLSTDFVTRRLMPTPRATDGTKGGPNQRGSSGDLMLPSAVAQMGEQCSECGCGELFHDGDGFCAGPCGGECTDGGRREPNSAVNLLPTPRATRGGSATETTALLPTPMVGSTSPASHGQISGDYRARMADAIASWGDYAPAIARWEAVIGRTAPAPTEPGAKGNPRLSPAFVEWLMGLPAGHVTDPAIGITRNHQLKALGNGVVPQQAAAATRAFLHDLAQIGAAA